MLGIIYANRCYFTLGPDKEMYENKEQKKRYLNDNCKIQSKLSNPIWKPISNHYEAGDDLLKIESCFSS